MQNAASTCLYCPMTLTYVIENRHGYFLFDEKYVGTRFDEDAQISLLSTRL